MPALPESIDAYERTARVCERSWLSLKRRRFEHPP